MNKISKVIAFSLLFSTASQAQISPVEMLGAAMKYNEACASIDRNANAYAKKALDNAKNIGFQESDLETKAEAISSLNYGYGLADGVLIVYQHMLGRNLEYSCRMAYIGLISTI